MTSSPGVIATHLSFHASPGAGGFTARPDICDRCADVYRAARSRYGIPTAEREAHPDDPPSFGELMRRAGTPLK